MVGRLGVRSCANTFAIFCPTPQLFFWTTNAYQRSQALR